MIISPYCPRSWFTDVGRAKILKELMPKLPDVSGALFLTFTFDRNNFSSPQSAFIKGRDHVRQVMYELRQGEVFDGKLYKIDAPYFVKVEFHEDGWPHFHLIVRTRRFIPGGLLNEVWGFGRTNIRRIQNDSFHYLLKYVTKGGDLPEWVKSMKGMRIIQPSKGFYVGDPDYKEMEKPVVKRESAKKNESTIGERIERWGKMALVSRMTDSGKMIYKVLRLSKAYWQILQEHVLEIAKVGEYFGAGEAVYYRGSIFSKYQL